MIRLHIVVEGQTEAEFVDSVLKEPLAHINVFVDARSVETSRTRSHVYRGGMLNYEKAKKDLTRWMREDQNDEAFFTTMFDLYRLPASFPRFDEAQRVANPVGRVEHLEQAFADDMAHPRFTPYLQLHEFEALLFADPSKFGDVFIEHEKGVHNLQKVASEFSSPELIDDGKDTAPSKRIISEIPIYKQRKASAGPLIAQKIGLTVIRQRCAHFHSWLQRVESLAANPLM